MNTAAPSGLGAMAWGWLNLPRPWNCADHNLVPGDVEADAVWVADAGAAHAGAAVAPAATRPAIISVGNVVRRNLIHITGSFLAASPVTAEGTAALPGPFITKDSSRQRPVYACAPFIAAAWCDHDSPAAASSPSGPASVTGRAARVLAG